MIRTAYLKIRRRIAGLELVSDRIEPIAYPWYSSERVEHPDQQRHYDGGADNSAEPYKNPTRQTGQDKPFPVARYPYIVALQHIGQRLAQAGVIRFCGLVFVTHFLLFGVFLCRPLDVVFQIFGT